MMRKQSFNRWAFCIPVEWQECGAKGCCLILSGSFYSRISLMRSFSDWSTFWGCRIWSSGVRVTLGRHSRWVTVSCFQSAAVKPPLSNPCLQFPEAVLCRASDPYLALVRALEVFTVRFTAELIKLSPWVRPIVVLFYFLLLPCTVFKFLAFRSYSISDVNSLKPWTALFVTGMVCIISN